MLVPDDVDVDFKKDVLWSMIVRNLESGYMVTQDISEIEAMGDGIAWIQIYEFSGGTLVDENRKFVEIIRDEYVVELVDGSEVCR